MKIAIAKSLAIISIFFKIFHFRSDLKALRGVIDCQISNSKGKSFCSIATTKILFLVR